MIREFQKADTGQVMKIWLNSNEDAHFFIPKSYWESNFNMVQEQLLQARIFIYEEDGIIQGFAGLMDDYIAGIFVDKKYRSQGVGRQILDEIKKESRSLLLEVYKKNKRAVEFYFRQDFTVLSEGLEETTGEMEYTMVWKAK